MEFEELVQKLEDAGLEPRSYSGRGMYGDSCVGVGIDRLWELEGLGLPEPTTDQLGKGIIAYWPHIEWEGR